MDSNHWITNQEDDKEILAGHDLMLIANQLSYIHNSWLWQNQPANILITSSHTWLGHYLLYLLTQYQYPAKVTAISYGAPPVYLTTPRYKTINCITTKRRWLGLHSAVTALHPQIIFHTDVVWDMQEPQAKAYKEINIIQTELLCRLACSLQIPRIILFSDSSIYGIEHTLATENSPLNPLNNLAKSFVEAENIASACHNPPYTEIYHLRLAPLYGQHITTGIMRIAKLIADGILLGLPQNAPYEISLVSGHDVALAAFLVGLAPQPGHRIFNISTQPVLFAELLRTIALFLPCHSILGISSRFISMSKIGYQDQILIPTQFLQLFGNLCQHTTGFLNKLRWNQEIPLATTQINTLFHLRAINSRRFYDSLGWCPTYHPEKLQQILEHAQQHRWYWTPAKFNTAEKDRELLDCVLAMVQAVSDLNPDLQDEVNYWPVYRLGFQIDTKSLWILLDRMWNLIGMFFLQGYQHPNSSHHFLELFPKFTEKLFLLIHYEHDRAKRKFPTQINRRIHWLTQQLGSLDRTRCKFYIQVTAIAHVISFLQETIPQYADLLQLLPDKNFGLLLASEMGDIGIVIEIKNCVISVKFLRTEIDNIPRTWSLHRRLLEFQKIAKLHIALAVRIDKFLQDILSGQILAKLKAGLGKDYILSDTSQHYQLIGEAVGKTTINTYIFLDSNNQPAFGVQFKNKKLVMISPQFLEMVRLVRQFSENDKQMVLYIAQATQGQNELLLLKIQTVRRLLTSVIAPSRFRSLIFRLLESATKLSRR